MKSICTIVASLVLAGTTFADTFNVPADYPTIQGAIDASSDGDEVVVAPGTYTADGASHVVDFKGKQILLRASGSAEDTVISGEGSRRGVVFHSGETRDSKLVGFTIYQCRNTWYDFDENGQSGWWEQQFGGGILIYSCSPTIQDCVILENSTTWDAGGAMLVPYAAETSPLFVNCAFVGNTAQYGGAIRGDGATPSMVGCEFVNNSSYGSTYPTGGAIQARASSIWYLESCSFTDNTAAKGGGAIGMDDSGQVVMVDCTFSNNTAAYGGAISLETGSSVSLSNSSLSSNTANSGGGIWCDETSTASLTNTVVCSNGPDQIHGDWLDDGQNCVTAQCDDCEEDDGILLVPDDYSTIQAAIDASSNNDVIEVSPGMYPEMLVVAGRQITIRGNSEDDKPIINGKGMSGPMLDLTSNANCTIENLVIQDAAGAYQGAGINVKDSTIHASNCHIKNNYASYGGGFYISVEIESIAPSTITNCRFINNGATHWNNTISHSSTTAKHLIADTLFVNESSYHGGVLFNQTNVERCIFTGCSGIMYRAGLFGSNVWVDDCIFYANGGGNLLGVYFGGPAPQDVRFSNCVLADVSGTVLNYPSGSDVRVENSSFCGTTSSYWTGSVTDDGGNTMCQGPYCMDDQWNRGLPCDCPDIESNYSVDILDLLAIIDRWGSYSASADLTADSVVNIEDILVIIDNWGLCP